MSSSPDTTAALPRPTIFISYASEDRAAARQLRDTLEAAGLDVWYDENELGGGDAWDQKIRRQIRDCEYFMPVISATTEARKEGYFRREWRLAIERAGETGLVTQPLPSATDAALTALGQKLDATFVLGATLSKTADASTLTVHLLKAEDGFLAWSGSYPINGRDPAAISEQIATAVLAAVPKN